MTKELKGDIVFDGGAIIEMVYSTPAGKAVLKDIESGYLNPFATEIGLAEAHYILCRNIGEIEASSRINDLRESHFFTIEPISSKLSEVAATYKCERSISLADCFSLALAKLRGIPVLFAAREKELETEIERKSLEMTVLFLEDYAPPKG